ncbi:MAG: 4-hydroxybutyrate CoA-transferase [Deltaproteobacteria bacterium]|nr:4-hydroxybutyrate CoA-transferase [Candidatus Zymogenaceae bacterium]
MSWEKEYQKKLVSADKAVAGITSNNVIMMSGGCSAPPALVDALCKRKDELKNVTLISGISVYPFEFYKSEFKGHINFRCLFMGPAERIAMKMKANIEPVSFHLSQSDEIVDEMLEMHDRKKYDYMMCEVSEPDARGYMSYGPNGVHNNDTVVPVADKIAVQVNKETPFVHGIKNVIHVSEVDYIVEESHPLPEIPQIPISDVEQKIGELIAERIPNGATIQIGVGGVSDTVGELLISKKDLGIHSEMLTNSMMHLTEKGVVTGKKKTYRPGKIVCGFAIGSKALYDFIDNNPVCEFSPIAEINNVFNIAQNDNFVSVNNILNADLTGQCASESIGFQQISGTGGQLDFVRGANMSKGGMGFLAMPSVRESKDGPVSRIVSTMMPGTVITTPRSDVHYIVTEYGVANLRMRSIPERVKAMIAIAHPDFRDQLTKEAVENGLLD